MDAVVGRSFDPTRVRRAEVAVLEVRGVTVCFGSTRALDALDITVRDGEVLAVLGPSGCGKSTLLRVIAGLQTPDAGSVHWDGHSLESVPAHRRNFGLMFQDFALFPHKTVAGNVAFGLRMLGVPAAEVDHRVAEALERVGLQGYQERSVAHLSGGEQQRVALARALAPAPRLIMLDEPLGSLDRTLRERLLAELRELFVDLGITAVYVTHDQEEAFTVCDRMVLMRAGRVIQSGTPEEVWRRPTDEWAARFLGFTNIVEAELRGGTAVTPWARFAVADRSEGHRRLVLRPDVFALEEGGPVRGTVLARVFRGGHYLLRVRIEDGPTLEVEADRGPAPTAGQAVALRPAPEGVVVLGDPPSTDREPEPADSAAADAGRRGAQQS
ncbi:MAG: ABC transporter ATP-binding protein [Thermoleophilia bacterium]